MCHSSHSKISAPLLALAVCLFLFAAPQQTVVAQSLDGIKCIVSGEENAQREFSASHEDGSVYFCCAGCKKAFNDAQTSGSDELTVKANHQLVLTGQYVQTACPISGGKMNAGKVSNIGGAEISFCCGKCQGKVDGMADTKAKAQFVFSAASFKKHFAKQEMDLAGVMCPMMPKVPVKAKHAADFAGGKVHFCCPNCKKKFDADAEKFTTAANHQLVQTGQFTQKACPISGGAIDAEKTAEVGDVKVAFCCGNCVAQVESATDEAAKKELVFKAGAFEKGFAAAEPGTTK